MRRFYFFEILLALLISRENNLGATSRQPEAQKLKVVTVALGEEHSLVLTSDGTVWAFGLNGNFQTAQETNPPPKPETGKKFSCQRKSKIWKN